MGSGASVGLATGAATAGADLSCAISSLACFSSCSTFCVATASSLLGLSRGRTGSGVLARRLASVLPPPSRFACARISALVGLDFDLALTSATSSGGPLRSSAESSKALNLSASTNAWSRIEPPTAVASNRSDAVDSAATNGSDMVRGSDSGAAGRSAGLRTAWARGFAAARDRAGLAGIAASIAFLRESPSTGPRTLRSARSPAGLARANFLCAATLQRARRNASRASGREGRCGR